MSRIPPGLLYLTIYNPSLRPTSLTSPDDEDAEEQAQILFYTARERAVSRDRMLRQVGLAKALVNFSDMFNSENACENVHSQTRRMATVELEPNYWIHACVELAKTPRSVPSKRKGKAKNDASIASQEEVFDYHDSSVHDLALRSHIMRGYEDFKLTHGSFTSILSSLGQHALELQLERFFTVWAWKWDIEQHTNLAVDLGVPLHPLAPSLIPIVDDLAKNIQDSIHVFALAPPHIIPSTLFNSHRFPASLIRHVVSRIPPPAETLPTLPSYPSTNRDAAQDIVPVPAHRVSRGIDRGAVAQTSQKSVESAALNSFMAMSNVTRAMDPRQLKWGWPDYLSFKKGTQAKSSDTPTTAAEPRTSESATTAESSPGGSGEGKADEGYLNVRDSRKSTELDRESLQEALSDNQSVASTHHLSRSPSPASGAAGESNAEDGPRSEEGSHSEVADRCQDVPAGSSETSESIVRPSSVAIEERTPPPASPLPILRPSTVHLADSTDSIATYERRVWQLTSDEMTVALLTDHDSPEPSDLVSGAMTMIRSLREALVIEQTKAASEKPMPSATTILQPHNAHILAVNGYTLSSSRPLPGNQEHLYHAKQMFQSDDDVYEVFSRGQNPQHWHVAKRRLEVTGEPNQAIYMEIARKESTLPDADNEVAAVVREFAEHDDWTKLTRP